MGLQQPAERVREVLNYDPETGHFFWRVRGSGRPVGRQAGTIDSKGYRVINLDRRIHKAHRLAWLYIHGEWPDQIDHINCDKLDNRICNLRIATTSQNNANTHLRRTNTTGFKGVHWHKRRQRWAAHLMKDGREIWLGYFSCPVAAHQAYQLAASKHFGEFARAV